MRSPQAVSLLAAVLQLTHHIAAEIFDVPSVDNFVRRFSCTSIVLGNYVYIDGGEVTQYENGSNTASASNIVNSTLSLDLTTSWTTTEAVLKSSLKAPGPAKGNVVLWADHARKTLYSWGGKWQFGANMKKTELWKFLADGSGGGKWSTEQPSNPSRFNELVPAEFIAFATVNNTGYAIGGQASGWTQLYRGSNQAIPGMLSYNFDTREWTNETDRSPFHTLAQASAHYVPTFGPGGVVMVMGGSMPDVDRAPSIANSPAQDFQNLTFFDPAASKTYWQVATGEIPPSPRSEFCSAGWQNTDGGYEIFIFGGDNKAVSGYPKYRDAYVLSLPGFVWTKLPEPPAGGRAYHSCVSVGKRQVLSIGGLDDSGSKEKDKAPQGLLVFDMTAMKWVDFYNAGLGVYEAPGVIKDWYAKGSLDKVQWSSETVKKMFVEQKQDSPGKGDGDEGTSTEPNNSEPTRNPVAAIAGGVVGGVVALAAIGGVAWFILRRRRQGANGIANNTDARDPTYQILPPILPGAQYPAEVSDNLPYSELSGDGRAKPNSEKQSGANGLAELPHNGVQSAQRLKAQSFTAELHGDDIQR
ncbi:hypothetical protein B0T25DRAFT_72766 [Lasiosphaeria hispida]|uniref:Kelch repeat protein n=1 Tax=Lasiosphaeria hispida TaxID=260671 RepID=A0AAJ0HNR4_9PEZI|nr:hypothetical protein B0T25DRAFT_72766 [Lasiosphaeria hispida]